MQQRQEAFGISWRTGYAGIRGAELSLSSADIAAVLTGGHIQALDLLSCRLRLPAIQENDSPESVVLTDCELADGTLEPLKTWKHVVSLGLAGVKWNTGELRAIESLPLVRLSVARTKLSDADVNSIANARGLEFLDLQECTITRRGLETLMSLPSLRKVLLTGASQEAEVAEWLSPVQSALTVVVASEDNAEALNERMIARAQPAVFVGAR